jgi:hypothetical protein
MIALLLLLFATAAPARCTETLCEETVELSGTPADEIEWEDVRETYGGIRAMDPRGGSLANDADGARVPVASDGIHDWFPGGRKSSLCGELREFGDNCLWGGALAGECDLNNFITPDPA